MARWARTMIRLRWAVLAVWLAAFVAAGVASAGLSDLLTNRFVLPGAESDKARNVLQDHFGQKPEGSFSIVVKTSGRDAGSLVPQVQVAAQRATKALPTGKVASVSAVSNEVVIATIVSSLDPADAKGHTEKMRQAAGTIPGAQLYVTGQSAVEHDLEPVMNNDLKVGELFIAIPIAMVILIFVFGSLAFLLPFMLAAAAIPVTLGILWIFANFMDLSTYLTNLVMLIGLGIAVDYSLLMVYRYREEHRAGRGREDSIVRTMETAGRAVIFSGTAVAIGLALMLAMPLPFMRGFGLAGLLIPLVSVLAAMTLLPVLLYWLEDRLDRVRLVPKSVQERRWDYERGFWARLAGAIMRRPVLFATGTIVLLLAAAGPVTQLELTPGSNKGVPQNLEAIRGLNVLEDAVGAGALAPSDVVINTGRPGGTDDASVQAAVSRLQVALSIDPEVARVDYEPQGAQYVDATRQYLHMQITGNHEYGLPPARDFADRLRDEHIPGAGFPAGVEVLSGRRRTGRRGLP